MAALEKHTGHIVDLFGGNRLWHTSNTWTASDDRVRGGKSQSYLEDIHHGKAAHFHGTLDIKTLGGAGFASQRTTAEDSTWDLSAYHGMQLRIGKADGKKYTLILKDTLPTRRPDGRDEAVVNWEYDFTTIAADDDSELDDEPTLSRVEHTITIPWSSFKPTFKGREKKDASPLQPWRIRRFSIMMRSFFGSQEGAFSLHLTSVSAYGAAKEGGSSSGDVEKALPSRDGSMASEPQTSTWIRTWWRTICWLGLLSAGVTLVATGGLRLPWARRWWRG